jgi:hypothetical protein
MDSQNGVKPPVFPLLLKLAYLLKSQVRIPFFPPSCEDQASLQRHDDGHADAPSLDP